MEIEPISMTQRKLGRDGREYEISAAASHIVARLHELDASLRVRYNDTARYFVVYQLLDAGKNPVTSDRDAVEKAMVLRVPDHAWDDRVIKEWEMRAWEMRHGISAADRLEASDAKRHADVEYAFEQEIKERAYPLYRTMQRIQLGSNPRAFIRKGLAA